VNGGLLLRRIRVDPARGGARAKNLPFLSRGPVDIELRGSLTFLIGENGSGKTTLLEAVAANCATRPDGGRSYAETDDEREDTVISAAVEVTFGGRRPKGFFLRADRFAETMARAGRLPMPTTGEWRLSDEQSRGEGVLSLLTARVDASEAMLFILDEPETGLSPQRQMALLCLLDQLFRDGRSQALVATHSPILMSHPGCDLLWIDGAGITRRKLSDIQHWRDMQRFMANPDEALERLLGKPGAESTADSADGAGPSDLVAQMPAARPGKPATHVTKRKRVTRLWVMSDLHFEAVPHPEGFRPVRPEFDVLVVAGDVWEGETRRALEIVAALANGKPAVFVMGNHEPWNGDLQEERDVARRAAKSLGITLLDDSVAEVAGLSFVGGTLWADGRLTGGGLTGEDAAPPRETGEQIKVLRDDAKRLITNVDEALLHARTRGVIEAAMARPRDEPLVIVTHHAPHPVCLPLGQRTGWAAGNAASDLSPLTDAGQAALWVHGHVHGTLDIARPGGTRIVCNAAGPGFANLAFRDDWVVEV
jgi:predicted ATPase/Icc-related predicted phosphoesterase